MKKITFKDACISWIKKYPTRATFLQRIKVSPDFLLNVSGNSQTLANFGDTMEILLKNALGLEPTKEQGQTADLVYNGIPYAVKALDNESRASKGHENISKQTIIVANYSKFVGVYVIDNDKIVYDKSNKIACKPTLERATFNQKFTSLLLKD